MCCVTVCWSHTMIWWRSQTSARLKNSEIRAPRCRLLAPWPGWHPRSSEMNPCLRKWISGMRSTADASATADRAARWFVNDVICRSFGVVLWEMLTGEIPYKDVDSSAIIWGVGNNSLQLPLPESCPDGFKILLRQCWWAVLHPNGFKHRC